MNQFKQLNLIKSNLIIMLILKKSILPVVILYHLSEAIFWLITFIPSWICSFLYTLMCYAFWAWIKRNDFFFFINSTELALNIINIFQKRIFS